ncbi:MAG: nucleotidyl transferase AbiEii/AbiGii toxin family protein [Saprospiraceae bacterium]|nr:nucleotidyl transferase AbiEii/AbiGii toxin family protein [Saprospiraceae bacterium]
MLIHEMKEFHLVGGTALSLMYGHRMSIDLDLFSTMPFDNKTITDSLINQFNEHYNTRISSKFGIFGFVDALKIDIVRYPHPLIRPTLEIDGIRLFSVEDIMAMKIQAILGRGKKKDFWDIAELLKHFSVDDFVRFHKEKFSTQNLIITVPQAMLYFADSEEDEDPISLQGQSWASVKQFIQKKVADYLK